MSEDRGEIVSVKLRPQKVLNPEKNCEPSFKAQEIWSGRQNSPGLKDKLDKDSESKQMITDLEGNPDLLARTITRYQLLRVLTIQEARDRGALDPKLKNTHETYLATLAFKLEKSGQTYSKRVKEAADGVSHGDGEKANLIHTRMIDDFVKKEHDLLLTLVDRISQNALSRKDLHERIDQIDKHPRASVWREDKEQWKQTNAEAKQELLEKYTKLHPNSVVSTIRHPQQPDYLYIYPKAYDYSERQKNKQLTKNVNQAQDRLAQRIGSLPDTVSIRNIPTKQLKEVFQELDVMENEVKIHLQPKPGDQPKILDRLLDLFDNKPEMRDKIGAVKVRIDNHDSQDELGNPLPEVVIYTNSKSQLDILSSLQSEFIDIEGSRRAPRFNQEVQKGFVYKAQSGGDVKTFLAERGVLDKFFDKGSNYSELRV